MSACERSARHVEVAPADGPRSDAQRSSTSSKFLRSRAALGLAVLTPCGNPISKRKTLVFFLGLARRVPAVLSTSRGPVFVTRAPLLSCHRVSSMESISDLQAGNSSQHGTGELPGGSSSAGPEADREGTQREEEAQAVRGEHSGGRKEAKEREAHAAPRKQGSLEESRATGEDSVADRQPQARRQTRKISGTGRNTSQREEDASGGLSFADAETAAQGRRLKESLKENSAPPEKQQTEESTKQRSEKRQDDGAEPRNRERGEATEKGETNSQQEEGKREETGPPPTSRGPLARADSEADRETQALRRQVKELLKAVEAEAATGGSGGGHGSQRGSVVELKQRGLVRQRKGEFSHRQESAEEIKGTPISL